MAAYDYKLCERCSAKTFYDVEASRTYPAVPSWSSEGHIALCEECFKTHKVVVVPRT